jgi:protein-L-isoaspartate O-methyltransferase
MATPEQEKARQRAVWAAGDYPDLATTIAEASDVLVDAAGVQAGDAVLDVATGTGNAALVAARLGARHRHRLHRASRSRSSTATPRGCPSTTAPSTG